MKTGGAANSAAANAASLAGAGPVNGAAPPNPTMELPYAIILIVLVALALNFLNGMNATANSIATVEAIHVLPTRWAAI